jgi:hypothetical protein
MNESGIRSFTAGEALEADRRVKLSSGSAVYADAADKSIGITVDGAASGAQVAVKLHNFPGTRKVTAAAAITSGLPIYGADDGKANDVFAGTGEFLGIALEAATGDGSKFEVQPEKGGEELLYEILAQSDAAGDSSSSLVVFSNGSYTFPAGDLRTGDVLRVKAVGTHPTTNSSDNATVRLRLGTEVIATTPNPDAVNDDTFMIDAEITIREGGASGKVAAQGYVMNDALAAGLATPFHKAEAAEDLSGAVALDVSVQWSAAAANASRLQRFCVTRVRRG